MDVLDKNNDVKENDGIDSESRNPLIIFKTDDDKYGRDIALMSDFFGGYVHQMSLAIKEQSNVEVLTTLPMADLGILSDVVHQADIIIRGNVTLLPDFDNLSKDTKTNLKKGIYTVGESKQVEGNLRPVILDENGVRVKDITLKKVIVNPGNIEMIRSIGNQVQMRQIYTKLAGIQEIQSYQLEKDRDRDIIVPFLDARSLILEAETKSNEVERWKLIYEADGKVRSSLNALYADIETTSKRFAKHVSIPFLPLGNQIDTYMEFLTADLQIATKYVGVRLQILEYMGEKDTAKSVLQNYQHVIHDFLTKPLTRKKHSAAALMHDFFPYDKTNRNCWHDFSKEMIPKLEASMRALELSSGGEEMYIVSVEDVDNEIEEE